ncbi:MAG: sterol desaturase family protein [Pseudomonadota bacterium]
MLEDLIDKVIAAAAAYFDPRERMSVHWQLAALAAAVAYWGVVVQKSAGSGPAGLLKWLLPKDVIFHPSAVTDYFYFICNRLLRALVYAQFFVLSPLITNWVMQFLVQNFGMPSWTQEPMLPTIFWTLVVTLIIVAVSDATLWFAHWIFHVVPELWEFHKVHHSAEVMTPLTAARMHPVEEIVDTIIASTTVGTTYALLVYWLGAASVEFTIFEMNVVVILFFLAAFNLRHSHVFLRYPNWLQHIFISPAQHQIHHSRAPEHWDRNMGFIFSIWDWAAGTLVSPKYQMKLQFGLGTAEDGTWRGVRTLYLRPFGGAWRRFRARWGSDEAQGDVPASSPVEAPAKTHPGE